MPLSVCILNSYAGIKGSVMKRIHQDGKKHTKTYTSSQEKLFGEIQNSFLIVWWNFVGIRTNACWLPFFQIVS